jgi:hypothetical protein
MQGDGDEKSAPGLRQEALAAASTTASSFAATLDIIFKSQGESTRENRRPVRYRLANCLKELRLVCKATRSVVDVYVKTCKCCAHGSENSYLTALSPWPWHNINELMLEEIPANSLQREVECLVTLPLLHLKSLTLKCYNVLPLAQSNWPELTNLDLRVLYGYSSDLPYPTDLTFTKWPIKYLQLGVVQNTNVSFLGPFLKSCPDLRKVTLTSSCTKEMATKIVLANLSHLEALDCYCDPEPGFFQILFDTNWPTLKNIQIPDTSIEPNIFPLLAAQRWLTNLEDFTLCHNEMVSADELHALLKALGAIKKLDLRNLSFTVLPKGFEGIELAKLEYLWLSSMDCSELAFDVSDSLNVLFNTCSFPLLKFIKLSYDEKDDDDPEDDVRWIQPPRKQLIDAFPRLDQMHLCGMFISRDVADYLGRYKRKTGCVIKVQACNVEAQELSAERKQLLDKLGLDVENWEECCSNVGCYSLWQEESYWGMLSNIQYMRMCYACALDEATNATKLKNFIELVETEDEGSVMTAEVLESLKNLLNTMLFHYKKLGVREQLTWDRFKINTLIDYHMNSLMDYALGSS